MRKHIGILFVMMIMTTVSGCGKSVAVDNSKSETYSKEESNLVNKPYDAAVYSTGFHNYDELSEQLISRIDLIQSEMEKDSIVNKVLADYAETINKCNVVKVPKINNEYLELLNQEDFSNISLQVKDFYNSPWIYYHFSDNDFNSYVKIMNLNDESVTTAAENGPLYLMKKLDPLPDDDLFYPPYIEVSEEIVSLNDISVKAVVGKNENDPRIYTNFVYDDVLVIVCCSEEKVNAGFLEELSFADMELR